MGTKKLKAVSNVCAAALAVIVIVLTVQNVISVFDGSYQDVKMAWYSNWVVGVAAVVGMFAVTSSVQRRWLRIKLIGTAGILGIVAFIFFGLAVVVSSIESGNYGPAFFQGWSSVIGVFIILFLTSYINRCVRRENDAKV